MVDEHIIHTQASSTLKPHPVLFVGAGPGDPELITVKGRNALQNADLIIYAGSLVPQALLTWVKRGARTLNSARMNLIEIVEEIEKGYRAGQQVVRLHTGDPSLYGAIFEQIVELQQRSISYRIIPGVTAAFAAAAELGMEFTLPEVTQTLILTRMAGKTPVPDQENLASLAAHRSSMVIYLSTAMIDRLSDELAPAYGSRAPCAVVYRASQPDQKIIRTTLDRLADSVKRAGITRQAVVVIGKPLSVKPDAGLAAVSKLYDKHHSHMFRKSGGEE